MTEPSAWFVRFQPLIPAGATVLDLAAGGGRHVRFFSEHGCVVTAIDRDTDALEPFADTHGTEVITADLEDGSAWPLADRQFDAIVVCNYLHRPLFNDLIAALKPGGVLLYETFALGNEVFSRPRNPDHLLRSGELLDLVGDTLNIVAYQHGIVRSGEAPGVKQMICALHNRPLSEREDGEPDPVDITP